jgi:hypothetical protein
MKKMLNLGALSVHLGAVMLKCSLESRGRLSGLAECMAAWLGQSTQQASSSLITSLNPSIHDVRVNDLVPPYFIR